MKKILKLIFGISIMFIGINFVNADTLDFCGRKGVVESFRIAGYFLTIIKILVPIGIIIVGMMDFAKAMLASDDSAIKKAGVVFVKRIIAGVVVFLIPTIINFAFSLVDSGGNSSSRACVNCVTNPATCSIPSKD